jgi:3-oxoacyl-[acyl-carrier protein] reductase
MDFTGKTVVITGAGGIYGRQFSKAFAREGARLVLTDRKLAGLTAVSRELALPADRLRLHAADLTDEAAIAGFIAATVDAVGCPDIVVCNAGIYPFGGLLDTTGALWDEIMAVNLKAPFLLTQGFARLMIERGVKGSFVCIGSGAAHVLRTNGLAYCVSKRGLDWLVKGMALELAHWGIRVNAVEPGLAIGSEHARFPTGYVESMAERIPLRRMGGEDEAANAVLFLASDAASYITGAAIPVDGGSSIPRRALSPPVKQDAAKKEPS